MYGGGGGQWPGQQPQQQQQQTGYMQPQATGYMGMQPQRPMMTGMPPHQSQGGYMGAQPTGMMPQATGMGMGMGMGAGMPGGPGFSGMRQTSFGQPTGMGLQPPGGGQQRFLSPQPMQMQPTGMMQSSSPRPGGMQPQMTGYPGGMMGMQPTGMMGMQATGIMPQMTGMPLDPRMQLMSAQFLPGSTPYSGAPMAGNMNFSSQQMQPASFQSSIQNLSQQQQGSKEPKIPWALSKDERKSYDQIFRAWDQKGTGFLGSDVAREVFGQSGLDRDKLMQIWHLSDTENRGKLNLAEFHVAMGLIYRALNGNDIPEHLPQELIPPSAKDLSDSVDFLKDLLKRDANVRQTTALNLPESGSNRNASYGKTKSFHENPIQKQDAAAYKHTDEAASTGYKSSARHLDRRTVRYGGESPADDLTEMKRQLAHTQRMLESQGNRDDDDDREIEKEMEELRFRIKNVQDDIDYYNRRGGRDAAENRRKAERELLHLMHERLPLLEKRLDEKDKKKRDQRLDESRDRDRRNQGFDRASSGLYDTYGDKNGRNSGRQSDYSDYSRSQTPTQRDRDQQYQPRDDSVRSPPPPPPAAEITKPAPAPPASPSVAAVAAPAPATASSGPPKNMTPEERQAWIRSEAQRRIAERMRALGAAAPSSSGAPTPDSSVEQRLAADKAEAEQRAAEADAEALAREETRRARLEEQRLERERAAVSTIKSELKEQEKAENAPPSFVIQAAREEVNEQEEMLRRREEVLKKEAAEREARFKKLEEEEAEAKRQEEAFREKQSQFQRQTASPSGDLSGKALPAPVRKGKSGPAPPPPSRSRAPAPPAAPPVTAAVPAPATGTSPAVSSKDLPTTSPTMSSTNPFHRMQQANGAAPPTTPGGGMNPFFRDQGAAASTVAPPKFDLNLPAPQRTAAPNSAPAPPSAPPAVSNAPSRRAPDDDDDWGESEHGDQDDEDPDGPGSTSRATRQNLAAALFSGLVSTPPQSSSPAPQTPKASTTAPAAPLAPALDEPPAPPPAPPAAPGPPVPPPAPVVAPIAAPSAGPADRGALLGQIRGGLSLRKAQTSDRSAAGVSGKVLGDASAPVQKYIPPPSPPVAAAPAPVDAPPVEDEFSGSAMNPNRQSVDWANSLAADQMHAHVKASAVPDEPSLQEENEGSEDEGPEDANGAHLASKGQNGGASFLDSDKLANGVPRADLSEEFDLAKKIRVRTLYPYESQRDEDLSFAENMVVQAHPAKDEGSDWWYGTLVDEGNSKTGTFPRTYVHSIETPKVAKALYDFEGSSPEEMNFKADEELHVVDDEDENWWKVVDGQDRILIVPATYVELVASDSVQSTGSSTSKSEIERRDGTATAAAAPKGTNHTHPAFVNVSRTPSDDGQILEAALKASERDERERTVNRAREEKDLRRALELSKAETVPLAVEKEVRTAQDVPEVKGEEDDEYSSGYSTTGWTSSEDDDEDDDDEGDRSGDVESEMLQRQRVAERLRVLEAAGILVVEHEAQDGQARMADGRETKGLVSSEEVSKQAEDRLLRRRSTHRKPRPERPERTIGQQRKSKSNRPSRPERPPPPAPAKEREPEVQMDDAYDRFVKLSKEIQAQQQEKELHTDAENPSSATVSPPSSPAPMTTTAPASLGSTMASAGSGLLSSIKSISSGRRTIGATSPSTAGALFSDHRKATPTISGPMMVTRTQSPPVSSVNGLAVVSDDRTPSPASMSIGASSTWAQVMGKEAIEAISEQERKRQESIFELIATESTHVRDVQIIVDVFFNAIQPLLQAKAATVIFGNVEEVLLAAVSLLSDVEDRQKSSGMFVTRIGDLLERHMSQMAVYIPYCVNQETASHILTTERQRNGKLDELLAKVRNEHPSARGLDLSHFLLAPMQRITRYPLLIGQIVRYSSDEKELRALQRALKTAQGLLDTTNESIRQRQSDERLALLSERINHAASASSSSPPPPPSSSSAAAAQIKLDLTQETRWMGKRKVLRDEVLTKQKSGRRITLVLCNDVVLLLSGRTSRGGVSTADQYLYRMPMPLEELVVRDVPAGLTGRDDLAFQLVHQGREKVNLRCSSARACHSWMHSIDSARADCLSAANKVRR